MRVGAQGYPSECRGALVSAPGGVTSQCWVSLLHLEYSTSALPTSCAVSCRYIRTDLAEQVHDWLQSAATPEFVLQQSPGQLYRQCAYMSCTVISSIMRGKGDGFCECMYLMCHLQVLKDPENKRKVLERTPMRRIGETHEVSGAPSCRQEQLLRASAWHQATADAGTQQGRVHFAVSTPLLRRCCGIPVLASSLVCDR